MIYTYGITEQGAYHVKNNIPCQDEHYIVKYGDNMIVAAVADGCGSEEHSDIASKIAAKVSVDFCVEHISMPEDKDDILNIIKKSFLLAQNTIEQKAKDNGHSVDQYDTTLTLAVMYKDTLYYGHSGDSGILALTAEGLYEQVTEQQQDEEGRVFYLFCSDKWVFKKFEKQVCSVLLATDGIFEPLFPYLIKYEPVNIHVSLARFFMDNKILQIDELGEDAVKARIADFIHNISDEQVNDDKTIVVLVNPSIESKEQSDNYYKEPDWVGLKKIHDEKWKHDAYPHLFKEQKDI
ncbi:MAG: protein phosphatase 2C domain-containing protein [Chitinispirillales bacterium]|jgi:serine/threonine protein phosphatase PrpC|nr:protein phosphatase 2C domain-containing protein [Chitinispirillales bacterium]